jgi:hypothetical protein
MHSGRVPRPEIIDFIQNAPNRSYENIVDLMAGATQG